MLFRFLSGFGMKKLILLLLILTGCGYFAVTFAPKKTATRSNSGTAVAANRLFFSTLHAGRYEEIPSVLTALQTAYLENPNDPELASHIAMAHIWQLAERYRSDQISPRITDNIVLCRRYFAEAYQLDPNPVNLGFLGSCTAAEGNLFKDEKLQRKGYYLLKDGIAAWPEFNYFTMGYIMSALPYDSPRYAEALELQWKNLDACISESINRAEPKIERYLRLQTTTGPKRACWNSSIAPHNDEGFFLNMGDMLVKSGDWRTAQVVYANAKYFETYKDWQFKDILEDRIKNAERNVAEFRRELPRGGVAPDHPTIMFQSRFACVACHQN